MNFDSVDDMYALAVRAADSADAVANHNGYMALTACRVHDRSRLEVLLAAAAMSPQDKERARAASLVLHRCAGVFNNDASAITELQQRLLAVVRRTPGFFTTARPPGKPTADEFQLAAQRGDWVTLQNIIDRRSLQMQTSEAAASQAVNEAALLAFAAGFLASCDLGRNCSADGFEYAALCVLGNSCEGSQEATFRQHMSSAQWAHIQMLRQQVVAAVRRRDARYFGLVP